MARAQGGTVVCAVDEWNADGAAAVRVARALAERLEARLLVVVVVQPTVETAETTTAGRARRVGEQRPRPLAETGLAGVERRIASGEPAEAVATVAAEEAADVIVVGAHAGLLAGTLRSAFARELAATASCPVVVAPPEYGPPAGTRGPRRSLGPLRAWARGRPQVQD